MERTTRRRRSGSGFWTFFVIFVAVLVLFWAVIIGNVYRSMKTYEAAQPERQVEQVIERLRKGEAVGGENTSSRFEDGAASLSAFGSLTQGKEITCRKSAGSYDAKAPVYDVYADGEKVAAVALKETSSRPLMFILTLQEWEVTSVSTVLGQGGTSDYIVAIPDSCTLYVNGIPADQRELTGNRVEVEQFQYAANYVTVPTLAEYKLPGLTSTPTLEVRTADGSAVRLTRIEDRENFWMADQFPTSTMDPDLEAYVLKNAKDYTNFFSGDLPGCSASIDGLRHMFPADSYYLDLAENYRLHDMWMYANHQTPSFSQEKVENYVRYSEDFFSCEISFDKKMILTRTGEERHDITHSRVFYVKVDGNWVIADMQQILGKNS